MKAKALTKAMGPKGAFCFSPGDIIELDEKSFESLFMAGAVEPIEPIESDAEAESASAPAEEAPEDMPAIERETVKPRPKRSRKSS